MFTFHKTYFFLSILIFCIEVFIALFVKDDIIRPYVGDILVVILIYCFLKSFLKFPVMHVVLAVLAFACIVEFLQFLNIVEVLNFEKFPIVRTIIGATFSWMDILSYILGAVFVLIVERFVQERRRKQHRIRMWRKG